MKNFFHKKGMRAMSAWAGVLLAAVALMPQQVHAQSLQSLASLYSGAYSGVKFVLPALGSLIGVGHILGGAIAWVIFVVYYVIGIIAGFGISVAAYFIEVLLAINTHIPNSLLVKQGFQISLAITNLFFVLGIIVIAIATILRSQTYGMKQILWKLIFMAILVNFGLVLTAPIIHFSDQLTTYFIDAFSPAGNGTNYDAFATSFAGAFTPQRAFLSFGEAGTSTIAFGVNGQSVSADAGASFGSMITPLLNIIFPILFLIFIGITLGTFVVMLFIRYVWLSYLLVLLPLAWVAWVFPLFKSTFQKWWHHFFRWTFFAPIVMFFLYLAILTSRAMSPNFTGPDNPLAAIQGVHYQPGSAPDGIAGFVGGFAGTLIGTLIQMAVVLAISGGGLVMANSLGITFADVGVGMAKSVSKGVGGYVGRRTKQVGTAAFRGETGQKFAASLQRVGTNFGPGFLGTLGRGISVPVRYAGRGIEALGAAGGEKAVEEAKKRTAGMTLDQKIHAMSTATAPERMAWLREIKDANRLPELGEDKKYFGEDRKEEFARYGSSKLLNELRNESGETLRKYIDEEKRVAAGEQIKDEYGEILTPEKATERKEKHFKTAPNAGQLAELFFQDFDLLKKQGKPTPLNLSDEQITEMQEAIVKGVGKGFSPSNMSSFFQKLARGDQLDKFKEIAEGMVKKKTLELSDIDDRNLKWLDSAPGARNLGVDRRIFGQQREPQSGNRPTFE